MAWTGFVPGNRPPRLSAQWTGNPTPAWPLAWAGRATAPATWLALGDSITEGQGASLFTNGWVQKCATKLRTVPGSPSPTGGVGWVPAVSLTVGPDSAWTSPTSPVAAYTGTAGYNYFWQTLDGKAATTNATNETITWTSHSTSFQTWVIDSSASGTYQVDSATPVSLTNGGNYPTLRTQNSTPVSSGTHTLQIKQTNSGLIGIDGIFVYDGDEANGLHVWNTGHYGALTSDVLNDWGTGDAPALLEPFWELIAPDVVTFAFGANEFFNNIDPAVFKSNVRRVLDMLRGLPKLPSIYLIAVPVYDDGVTQTYRWTAYQTVLSDLASEYSSVVTYVDLMATTGVPTVGGLFSSDRIHPNDSGHDLIATRMAEILGSVTATSITDDAGTTDSVVISVGRGVVQTDSAGSTDALTTLVGRGVAQTDDAGSTDALTAALGRNLAPTDDAGTTDSASTVLAISRTQTDDAGITDSASISVGRGVAQTDDAGVTDSTSTAIGRGIAQTDSAGTTDALSAGVGKGISDRAGTIDSFTTTGAFQRTQTDDAGTTDSTVISVGRGVSQTDSAGTTDSVTLAAGHVLNLTDDAGSTDAAQQSISSSGNVTQADDAGTTDSEAISVGHALSLTDSAGTTDTATAGLVEAVSATDSAGSTDTLALARGLGVADSAGSTDAISTSSARASAIADNAGSTDSIVIELIRAIAVSDNAGTTDSALISLGKSLTATDDAGTTDSVVFAVHHELVFEDGAGTTDTFAPSFQYTLSVIDDSGSTDAATVVIGGIGRDVTVVVTVGDRRTVATIAERGVLATAGERTKFASVAAQSGRTITIGPRHWSLSVGEQNG